MGEHDQAVLHDEDAHGNIHDDGRTLGYIEYGAGAGAGADHDAYHNPDAYSDKSVFRYSNGKLIPDTVHVRIRPFSVTQWESLYSSVFTLGGSNFSRASFAPIVDDSWRVVGHVGWADGNDILVPEDTVRDDRLFWSILQKVRLGEWRQQILDVFDRGRGTIPNFPFPPPTTSPPPPKDGKRWRGPENCVYRPHPSYRPTILEEARSGPLKEGEIDQYLHDLDKFVKGGGKAFVGRHFVRPGDASYLDLHPSGLSVGGVGEPRKPFSSAYELLVLVDPDGYLQGVMDIRKNLKTQVEWDLEVFLGAIDLAMTVTMIIEIVPIAVVLFRLGAKIAARAMIRAINLVVDREAKALLNLAEQEAKRVLELRAREAAAAKAAEEFAVETIVIDAKTEARWAARGNRLRVPEGGGGSKAVGELWREGGAEAEGFSARSGAKGPQAPRTDLTQPPRHVMKPEPIEDLNKGIPDHLKDASPAEKRKWIESPEGKNWRETKRLDGPSNNLDTQPPHGGPRDHDAEANMFERLEAATNRDTVGEFHFKVDRPVCPACKDMILRFAKERPRIKVIQHSLDNKLITP